MSNPRPLEAPPTSPLSGPPPSSIDKVQYPALEQMRTSCHRGGVALIDRVYAEAQALHHRAVQAEAELGLIGSPSYGAKLREAPVVTTAMALAEEELL